MSTLIKVEEVQKMTTLSRSSVYLRCQESSEQYDPTFPKPVKLGGKKSRASAWIKEEVQAWIDSLRDGGGDNG